MTTAIPDGESGPTIFVLDVRNRPWDGMGMAATQSHVTRLQAAPAVRLAWNGELDPITRTAGPFVSSLFTAAIIGVLDEVIVTASEQLAKRVDQLRPYERIESSRAELDHWVAVQAYEGALGATGRGDSVHVSFAARRAKEAVAGLTEGVLLRITRVLAGRTFSRRSPFAHWFEDVRALGFLRPPWELAHDNLFATSIDQF